jgi:hypothetical protein
VAVIIGATGEVLMMLTDELANANKARWQLAKILLGKADGDIEVLHIRCVEAAEKLMADAQAAPTGGEKMCVCNADSDMRYARDPAALTGG